MNAAALTGDGAVSTGAVAPGAAARGAGGARARATWRATYQWYVVKRLVQSLVVVAIVTVLVFALLHLAMPDGPGAGILGMQANAEQIDAFNHAHGYDLPVWHQYLNYVGQLAHGDLGDSFKLNMPVLTAIATSLPKTLLLAGLCMVIALIVALPMGIYQAVHRGKASDSALTALNFVVYSTPSFFFGLIVIIVFAQKLRWLPAIAPGGNVTVAQLLAEPRVLVLPVITGSVSIVATFSRYMRSATLDNLSEDYVRTARSKGTSQSRVIVRHVVRNSLTPVIAMLGYYLPVMFGGMLVVESLFNYPGMGLLFWRSAQQGDYPVLLGCVLIIAIATVVGSLLADLLQAVLDPRTRGSLR